MTTEPHTLQPGKSANIYFALNEPVYTFFGAFLGDFGPVMPKAFWPVASSAESYDFPWEFAQPKELFTGAEVRLRVRNDSDEAQPVPEVTLRTVGLQGPGESLVPVARIELL